jgi:hypothetical protein
MKKAKLLFAGCALLLAAPASAQLAVNCTKTSCEVTVIVPAGCGSGIHVAPDPIVVEKGTVDITWIIRSSKGWVFEDNGIYVYNGAPVYTAKSKGGGDKFTVGSKTEQKGTYKYDITLTTKLGDATKACKLDPTIVNW